MAVVVTPNDRPKSVCNDCVMELLAFLRCHFVLLTFLLVKGPFHRTELDIFLFALKLLLQCIFRAVYCGGAYSIPGREGRSFSENREANFDIRQTEDDAIQWWLQS